jgi:hypothetical protein
MKSFNEWLKNKNISEFFNFNYKGSSSSNKMPFVQTSGSKEGVIFGSFDKNHWLNEKDMTYQGDFDFDYTEERFTDFHDYYSKYGDMTSWFAPPGAGGEELFYAYVKDYGPFIVRIRKGVELPPKRFQHNRKISQKSRELNTNLRGNEWKNIKEALNLLGGDSHSNSEKNINELLQDIQLARMIMTREQETEFLIQKTLLRKMGVEEYRNSPEFKSLMNRK